VCLLVSCPGRAGLRALSGSALWCGSQLTCTAVACSTGLLPAAPVVYLCCNGFPALKNPVLRAGTSAAPTNTMRKPSLDAKPAADQNGASNGTAEPHGAENGGAAEPAPASGRGFFSKMSSKEFRGSLKASSSPAKLPPIKVLSGTVRSQRVAAARS
jgi:hypothetical protein